MQQAITLVIWFMTISSGLMAGVYFAFSAFGMAALGSTERHVGMTAMQVLNVRILQSLFMPLFLASSLASLALAIAGFAGWIGSGGQEATLGGSIFFIGMTLVTMAFNVPLNNRLAAADPASEDSGAIWSDYLVRWTRWNHVRTVACAAALVVFVLAIVGRVG